MSSRFDDSRLPIDIERLIEAENDPRARTLLIMLSRIADELHQSTSLGKNVAEKLESHLISYEQRVVQENEIRAQARGAWKVIAWISGAAQAIVISASIWTANQIEKLHATDVTLQQRILRTEISLESGQPSSSLGVRGRQ